MTYLKSFTFDKLLYSIYDVYVAVLVVKSNVASSKPTVAVEGRFCCFSVIEITFHNLRQREFENLTSTVSF